VSNEIIEHNLFSLGRLLTGWIESEVHPDVAMNALITLVPLASPPIWLQTKYKWLSILLLPVKALHQFWSCYRALARLDPSEFILVQVGQSLAFHCALLTCV
jgi:hypothetical protein